jgi:hypothetical protein
MVPHGAIGDPGSSVSTVPQFIIEIPSATEGILKPLTRMLDFVFRQVSSGFQKGTGVVRKRFHAAPDTALLFGCFGFSFHQWFLSAHPRITRDGVTLRNISPVDPWGVSLPFLAKVLFAALGDCDNTQTTAIHARFLSNGRSTPH